MLAGFGLDVKPLRMVSSPSSAGARHTIDNILGLARNGNGKEEGERASTPGNAESAGKGILVGKGRKSKNCYLHLNSIHNKVGKVILTQVTFI